MEELTQYRKAVDQIIAGLRYILQAIFYNADYSNRERLIALLAPQLTEVVRQHRARVYEESVVMLKRSAKRQGVANPYVPDISGYSEESVRTLLRRNLRGTPQEVARDMSAALVQHVESAGRQTIVRAVEDGVAAANPEDEAHLEYTRLTPEEFKEKQRQHSLDDDNALDEQDFIDVGDLDDDDFIDYDEEDDDFNDDDFDDYGKAYEKRETVLGVQPQAWARVLSGAENCGFCVMLASRGPVYKSAENAGRGQASDRDYAAGINTYHTNCDCLVVPVYNFRDWPGREQWKAAERVYKKVIAQGWAESYNRPHLREYHKVKSRGRYGISYNKGPSAKTAKMQKHEDGKVAPGQVNEHGNEVVNAMDRYLRSHDIAELHGVKNIREV